MQRINLIESSTPEPPAVDLRILSTEHLDILRRWNGGEASEADCRIIETVIYPQLQNHLDQCLKA